MPYRPHSLEDGGAEPTVIDLPGFLGVAVCREFTDGDREVCQCGRITKGLARERGLAVLA